MNRRQVLRAAGASGLAGLAGCSGTGVSLGLRPARFEQVAVRGPDEAAVGESFSVTVAATNTGGRRGDFTGTLRFAAGDATRTTPVRIPGVAPGETKAREVGSWRLPAAVDATFRVLDAGATHTVTGTPATLAGGGRVTVDGVELGVTRVDYGGRYRDAAGRVHRPGPDMAYAAVHVAAEQQAGGDGGFPPASAFRLRTDRRAHEVADRPLPAARDAYAPATDSGRGSRHAGWLPFTVPETATTPSPSVSMSLGDGVDARWSFRDVPDGVPRFRVRRIAPPPAFEVGTTETLAVVVSNVGDAAGRFVGTLARGEDRTPVASLAARVDAGATQRLPVDVFVAEHRPYEFRVEPDDVTAVVAAEPPVLARGEWFTVPDRWQAAMTDVVLGGDAVTYETRTGRRTYEPPAGVRLVFVELSVRNRTEERLRLPARVPLSLPDAGRVANRRATREPETALHAPVSGPHWTGVVPPESTASGWLVYEVPADASVSSGRVHLDPQRARGPEAVPVTFAFGADPN